MIDILSVLLGIFVCALALYLIWYALRFLFVWVGAYFVLAALVVLMLLIIYGVVGDDLGLSNLFIPHILVPTVPAESTALQVSWFEGGYIQFFSAVALSVLFLVISSIVHLLDRGRYSYLPSGLVARLSTPAPGSTRTSGRFWYSESDMVARLEKKRKQLTDPLHSAIADYIATRRSVRRVLFDDEPGPPPNLPDLGKQAILWTAKALLWRPCLFLAVLSAVPAFRNVWGWRGFTAETEWWWLLGLAVGLLLSWVAVRILTIESIADIKLPWNLGSLIRTWWQIHQGRPLLRWAVPTLQGIAKIAEWLGEFRFLSPLTDADPMADAAMAEPWRRSIFLLLWMTFSVLLGAALAFRDAGDVSTGRPLVNEAEPTSLHFAQSFDLLGFGALLFVLYLLWRRFNSVVMAVTSIRLRNLLRLIGLIAVALIGIWGSFRWFHVWQSLEDFLEYLASLPWLARFLMFLIVGGLVGLTLWLIDRIRRPPHPVPLAHRLIMGTLVGVLGFVLFWVSFRWIFTTSVPYLVSFLLCLLVGLVATVYAVFRTFPPTPRLAIYLLFLAILFAANGTNWIHKTIGPADDYKLQFDRMNRDTPKANRLASYYDYPVHLESKAYLDRTYLRPTSILDASNARPIVITSACAHRLRTGDRVRITGVQGNPAANGTFAVFVDPKYEPNEFALVGTQGCGVYTFGGEWIVELDQGRIIDVRQDPQDGGLTTIISDNHGLSDDEEIQLLKADGKRFARTEVAKSDDPYVFKVKTRKRDDARSASQFLVPGISAKQYAELRNGRWYQDPDKPEQGPRQGGVAWVTNEPATATQRAGAIVITTSDPASPPRGAPPTIDHGVNKGDHVLVEEVVANPDANGIWTVYRIDPYHFELLDPKHYEARGRPSPTEFLDFPPSFPRPASQTRSDWMSGGTWRVVTDRGRILDATNDKGNPIRIYSLSHELKDGDHVEITGVRGNTRANGIWTVKTVPGEPDLFELAGPSPEELITKRPLPDTYSTALPHMAEGGPKFDYRGNGQWRRVPDRGRLFAIRNRDSKLEFYSPDHHLQDGIVVEINGLSEGIQDPQIGPQLLHKDLSGQLFRVQLPKKSVTDPNWFGLQGVLEGEKDPTLNLGIDEIIRIANPAATWSLVYNRGPVWDVQPNSSSILVHSPVHGLQEGDHIRFSGSDPKLAGLSGLYSVHLRGNDPDRFEIEGRIPSAAASAPPNRDATEPSMPIGRWERVADTGPIQLAGNSNPAPSQGAITVRAPNHGLKKHTWVTGLLAGPRWAELLAFCVDVVDPNSFRLAGTEPLKLSSGPGQPRLSNSWRRLGSQAELLHSRKILVASEVRVVPEKAGEPKLLITSPGHGLKPGDRIRMVRIGLDRDGTPALGERYADTFAVESIEDNGDSFKIPVYTSWSKYQKHDGPKTSIELLKQPPGGKRQAVLCAWRPILDRGVIESLEPIEYFFTLPHFGKIDIKDTVSEEKFQHELDKSKQGDYDPAGRVRIKSSNHGLASGAWVFVLGCPDLHYGPFRIVETTRDTFDIEVIGTRIPETIKIKHPGMARWKLVDLLDDHEVLANWSDGQQSVLFEKSAGDKLKDVGPPPKPKLAIVTVSGGGIRSAVWTATVLSRLEKHLRDLPYQTRLITGASGGMVGAALYVATLQPLQAAPQGQPAAPPAVPRLHGPFFSPDPKTGSNPIVDALSQDQLTRVTSQLVLSDLPSMLWPKPWGTDRGQALESTWWRRTAGENEDDHKPNPPRRSPFALPFRSLALGEWEGWRPSLVFTPMLVEDGRRILISNLNLDFAPRNVGHVLFARGTDKLSKTTKIANPTFQGPLGDSDIYSLSAVEFFRVFPDANDFRLSTAARMSAAFPLITPAVSLPTVPARRVVDAGYYDNFGVNLASLWVFQNRDWLFDYTSGVVMIQIRDSQSERSRRELEDPDPVPSSGLIAGLCRQNLFSNWILDCVNGLKGKAQRGAQWLTSPFEGLSTARQANMSFRNDEQVKVLSDVINNWPDSPVRGRGFFTTVVFECPKEASLNWAITKQERRDIEQGFEPDQIDPDYSEGARRNAERLRILVNWWNR